MTILSGKSMYAAGIDQVSQGLQVSERPDIRLVKGWFNETLPLPEIQAIDAIDYVRIDCDIYEPSVPHLDFEFLFFGMWNHFYIRVSH